MGGQQIVVFIVHGQVVEALSLGPSKVDRANPLQTLGLETSHEGWCCNETSPTSFAQSLH